MLSLVFSFTLFFVTFFSKKKNEKSGLTLSLLVCVCDMMCVGADRAPILTADWLLTPSERAHLGRSNTESLKLNQK